MSKKHYHQIAAVIASRINQPDIDNLALAGSIEAKKIAASLADYFEQDSPQFNRARFLKACGIKLH